MLFIFDSLYLFRSLFLDFHFRILFFFLCSRKLNLLNESKKKFFQHTFYPSLAASRNIRDFCSFYPKNVYNPQDKYFCSGKLEFIFAPFLFISQKLLFRLYYNFILFILLSEYATSTFQLHYRESRDINNNLCVCMCVLYLFICFTQKLKYRTCRL